MRARTAGLVCVAALAFAGCGGDSSEDEAPATGGASTPAATADGGGDAPKTVDAAMEDFEFTPAKITVAAGGNVTWTDKDASNHNVKFDAPGAPDPINNLREGESASITFDKPGSYAFVCSYHPNMKGTVDVR